MLSLVSWYIMCANCESVILRLDYLCASLYLRCFIILALLIYVQLLENVNLITNMSVTIYRMIRRRSTRSNTNTNNNDVDPMQQFIAAMQNFSETLQNHGQQPLQPPAPDQALERFMRFHPAMFAGELDARKAELRVESVENLFGVLHYSDIQKIDLTIFQLEGVARHWWGHCRCKVEAGKCSPNMGEFHVGFS